MPLPPINDFTIAKAKIERFERIFLQESVEFIAKSLVHFAPIRTGRYVRAFQVGADLSNTFGDPGVEGFGVLHRRPKREAGQRILGNFNPLQGKPKHTEEGYAMRALVVPDKYDLRKKTVKKLVNRARALVSRLPGKQIVFKNTAPYSLIVEYIGWAKTAAYAPFGKTKLAYKLKQASIVTKAKVKAGI